MHRHRRAGNPTKKSCLHTFIVVARRTFSCERGREFRDVVAVSGSGTGKKTILFCSAALPSVLMLD